MSGVVRHMKKIRVLVVDDSALVRQVLSTGLSQDPELEVVGTATNPYRARDLIIKTNPDVMTLDVEMPGMDGVSFLRKLMPQHPIPVVMVSALTQKGAETTFKALEAGAVDFIGKPTVNLAGGLEQMIGTLAAKIKTIAKVNLKHLKRTPLIPPVKLMKRMAPNPRQIIAIGASTGGTIALRQIISQLPAGIPGVVVTQHMPSTFTKVFAQSIDAVSALNVKEAQNGDEIKAGTVLIAPGGLHLGVKRVGVKYFAVCERGPDVCGHSPSVDVLFKSVARAAGANAMGLILTGLGKDGAQGLLEMRQAGATTFGQDEASSVVYGMPKQAFLLGAVQRQVSLLAIPLTLVSALNRMDQAQLKGSLT